MVTTAKKTSGPRRKIEATCDLSDFNLKRRLLTAIGSLSGWYELSIIPRRNTRSLRQNSAWWALIVEPYFQFLQEQEYTIHTRDQAHELLKRELLTTPVVNRQTGEILGHVTGGTSELDTGEFCNLFERAQVFLAERGIVVPDPDPEWRRAAQQPNG